MAMEPGFPSNDTTKVRLPVVNASVPTSGAAANDDVDIDAAMREYEDAERERLGMKKARRQWVDTMLNPEVKKHERSTLTLLTSGLTAAQDFLVEGALRGQGYNVQWIGTPDQKGLQIGKEFGNRGQCNPTYFTVGMLVAHLMMLRDEKGLTAEQIVKDYVFFTAGACGPCRFGMYVTEYRKALRDAGFEGFRVMLFQQTGGLSQATGDDAGIEMNPPFFIAIVKALLCGDVLNALGYRLRPYEVVPGSVNVVIEASKKRLYKALFEKTNIVWALWQCRREFAALKIDRLRARPKVSIIGEFWAMTTEGDGNYQLQKFLESESGECDVQLITAWLLYNIWEVSRDTKERAELRTHDGGHLGLDGIDDTGVTKKLATMRLADLALRTLFNSFALPLGLHGYKLPDMDLIAEVAQKYYSNDLRGGEGHMEVGKLIVNAVMSKAHITVSVKPFGCMPSSGVSDGVQSLITSRYPGSIFCPVETSGDGATNFYSRVQMYMFKARQMAELELRKAYEDTGLTEQQVRDFLASHPRYASPLHKSPHTVAGTAADLVYEVAPFIKSTRAERAMKSLRGVATRVRDVAKATPKGVASAVAAARDPQFIGMIREDATLLRDLIAGKARDRFAPLVKRLAHRAITDRDPVEAVVPSVSAAAN